METAKVEIGEQLHLQLLCSCGLLISCGKDTVLVDAPNAPHRKFRTMDEASRIRFQNAQGEFSSLRGLVFTHTHPDHCDLAAAREFLRTHPRCGAFIPDYDTADNGVLRFGQLQVEYMYLPHMDVPEGMTKHYVLLISGGGKSVYVTADAHTDWQSHAAFLRGRHVDAAFWNPYYLGVPEMRDWMSTLEVGHNYIYHIPDDPQDESGVRRKAQRLIEQYGDTLRNSTLLYQYPSGNLME